MGLKCTMPKCRVVINGMTGLQEINKLKSHFRRKHHLELSMERALEFRVTMEAGHVPVRFGA